jgi:uncharacterized membrane protein YfcA
MNLRYVYSVIIGIVSGLLGGAFGLGGAFVMLPGVILLNVIPDFKSAVGTILFSLLPPISLLSVIEFGKRNQVDYTVGTILLVTYFFSSYYGSLINSYYDNKTLQFYCAISFLLISFYFFYKSF